METDPLSRRRVGGLARDDNVSGSSESGMAEGKVSAIAFELRATGMSLGSGGSNFSREPATLRRPLMRHSPRSRMLKQAYIYFIVSVKPY
jgi:hypothetical protein